MKQILDDFERYLMTADAPFSGWDFSWLERTQRMGDSPLPWSYASVVFPYLWRAGLLSQSDSLANSRFHSRFHY